MERERGIYEEKEQGDDRWIRIYGNIERKREGEREREKEIWWQRKIERKWIQMRNNKMYRESEEERERETAPTGVTQFTCCLTHFFNVL